MQKLSCLIIEDEPLLADVLADYIQQVPFLQLKKIFYDGISALEFLEDNKADLIFIDINLPKLKGLDFIRMFPAESKYIITTAYHEYALEGYELNVLDYLLKPIEFNRFLKAVRKAVHLDSGVYQKLPAENFSQKDYIYISMNKKRVKVNFSEILYIEGLKEYVKIHTQKDKWLITKIPLGQIHESLSDEFVRIHRSYIVAKRKVNSYNMSEVVIGNVSLPIGSIYKNNIVKMLEE